MADSVSVNEFYDMVARTLVRVSGELVSLRDEITRLEGTPWNPPLTKSERKIIHHFLASCALYQPNADVRRESWGTRGPSEFLAAIERVVQKLEQVEAREWNSSH
jgi:hypothetical protein